MTCITCPSISNVIPFLKSPAEIINPPFFLLNDLGETLFINHKRVNSASTSKFSLSRFDMITVSNLICDIVKEKYNSFYELALKSKYKTLMELLRRMCREKVYYKYLDKSKEIYNYISNKNTYLCIKNMLSIKEKIERNIYIHCTRLYVWGIFIIYCCRRKYEK